jgi:hypothetical protein
MTKEQLQTIRSAVLHFRESKKESLIRSRVRWSEQTCKRNWLTRFLYRLPNKPFTPLLALDSLQQESGCFSPLIDCEIAGWKALDLCDAVEAAQDLGLPLKLSVEDVNLLNSWLK